MRERTRALVRLYDDRRTVNFCTVNEIIDVSAPSHAPCHQSSVHVRAKTTARTRPCNKKVQLQNSSKFTRGDMHRTHEHHLEIRSKRCVTGCEIVHRRTCSPRWHTRRMPQTEVSERLVLILSPYNGHVMFRNRGNQHSFSFDTLSENEQSSELLTQERRSSAQPDSRSN